MIFTPQNVEWILSGRKTQTRRAWDAPRVEVGKTYALQPGRGKPAVARIRVTGLRQERLMAITAADAAREGCASVAEYQDVWRGIHKMWDSDLMVWVVDFELANEEAQP